MKTALRVWLALMLAVATSPVLAQSDIPSLSVTHKQGAYVLTVADTAQITFSRSVITITPTTDPLPPGPDPDPDHKPPTPPPIPPPLPPVPVVKEPVAAVTIVYSSTEPTPAIGRVISDLKLQADIEALGIPHDWFRKVSDDAEGIRFLQQRKLTDYAAKVGLPCLILQAKTGPVLYCDKCPPDSAAILDIVRRYAKP